MVYTWLRWDRQKEIDRDLHVMCQRLESYMEKLSGDSSWRMWKSWELKIAEVAGKDRQRSGWCERIRIHLYPVLPPRLFRNTMFPHIRRVNGTERITVQTQVTSSGTWRSSFMAPCRSSRCQGGCIVTQAPRVKTGTFLDSWTMYQEGAPLRSFPGKKQATSLEGSAYLWQWAISDTALRYEAANRKQYDFHIEAENFATPLDERIRNARSYTFSDISIRVQIHNAPF